MRKRKQLEGQARPRGGAGRPLGFDPDATLDGALRLFWRYGCAATSLDAIAETTGVARPSLMRLWPDKRALYLAAIERYRVRLRATLGMALRRRGPIDRVLRAFCSNAVDLYMTADPSPLGCLIINTASVATSDTPDIQQVLADSLAELDGALRQRVRAAAAAGELTAQADPDAIAFLVASLVHSLAVRARAGADERVLRAAARAAVAQILSR